MSTATASKPAASGTPRRDAASKAASSPAATRAPAKSATATPNGTAGVARKGSVRSTASGAPVSARAAAKRPAAASSLSSASPASTTSTATTTANTTDDDDDAREEQAAYLQALQDRLQLAETEASERHKQAEVLKARLDEALTEQAKLEERAHEEEEKVEALENAKRELTRQHRELEAIYEAEHTQAMREKEETQAREDELQQTIQRLKESHTSSRGTPSRSNSAQNLDSFAPPSSIQRSNSRSNAHLIHQKDKIIEDLRLELAEYQVKVLEVENAGGGRLRELEKQLLETRMTNARLMEDNESFQLLLGEKTLNGDLSRGDLLRDAAPSEDRAPSRDGPATSLADELQSVAEVDVEAVRRLEGEISTMREQNKALTLYINKIIGRLLTHQGFESVLGNDLDADGPPAPDRNKELPPPPPPQDSEQPQGFLQRAKSVALGGASRGKPRPMSTMGPPPAQPAAPAQQSAHEDPNTAPSIPLTRTASSRQTSGSFTHRRSASEITGAANVVNNMYRTGTTSPSAAGSPNIVSPRNSFFGLPVANPSAPRVPSGQQGPTIPEDKEVDASTISSSASHVDTPSPPRRLERSDTGSGPMTGKAMRPLRLVQNEEEAVKARKAANRASWFGGLFGQAPPPSQPQLDNAASAAANAGQ